MKYLTTILITLLLTACAQNTVRQARLDAEVSVVKFNFNKSKLKDAFIISQSAEDILDAYIAKNNTLYGVDKWKAGVVGRTDFKADDVYNTDLGMRRAQEVAKYLSDNGVNIFLIQSAGETDDVVIKPYRVEKLNDLGYRETNRSVTLITLHYVL